jgi:transcriptional regulator with XRE-family HTH domain
MEIKLKKVIARHLKNRGLSLNSLAKQSGIGTSTIHNWLNSVSPTVGSLEKLLRLASFLDISISELLLDQNEKGTEHEVLFQSTFKDLDHSYRLTIEKIPTPKKSKQ